MKPREAGEGLSPRRPPGCFPPPLLGLRSGSLRLAPLSFLRFKPPAPLSLGFVSLSLVFFLTHPPFQLSQN